MKLYPEIPGPSKAPHQPCIGFDKLDGSNLRFFWSKKNGFCKFGTRTRLFDKSDPDFGIAIDIFVNKYAEPIGKIIKDCKELRSCLELTAYCEFFGPSSFAGNHIPEESKNLILFDVSVHKKGFLPARDFVKIFGNLEIPNIIYEGNFGPKLVEDIREGKYPVTFEGVVCKGGSSVHKLWMTKIKTRAWMEKLKQTGSSKLIEEEIKQQRM